MNKKSLAVNCVLVKLNTIFLRLHPYHRSQWGEMTIESIQTGGTKVTCYHCQVPFAPSICVCVCVCVCVGDGGGGSGGGDEQSVSASVFGNRTAQSS
jgi:hypothetical protein